MIPVHIIQFIGVIAFIGESWDGDCPILLVVQPELRTTMPRLKKK